MTALTQAFEPARKNGGYVLYNVGASQTIWKGSLVVTRGDGYLYPLATPSSGRASDTFVGIADESVNNSAGSAGAFSCHVWKTGSFLVALGSAAITDLGTEYYGADDATVSTTSTNAVAVGTCTEYINASQIRIRIDQFTK